ncbi:MAG: ArdC family protein [Fusobacteriaceae bacterium]
MAKTREDFKLEMEKLKENMEDKIINLLKNSEELMNFINFRKKYFYQYSINNTLLIYDQKPNATFVAGFHKWKELGYRIKKGEKGIFILVPLIKKSTEMENKSLIYGFKKVTVFDISQTEATEEAVTLPEINVSLKEKEEAVYDPKKLYRNLKKVIKQYGEIEEVKDIDCYGKTDGEIMWIQKSCNPLIMASTLIHEFVHLYNHFNENRKDLKKNQKEIEAELGVAIVGSYFNLDISGQYNYLWMYKENSDIQKAFDVALETVELILYGNGEKKGLIKEGIRR